MHNTPHTIETRVKISLSPNLKTNFKDGRAKYSSVHKWVVRWFGRADLCENKNCNKKSKTFDWACITGVYEKDINNFKKLCRSCHVKLDGHCF
jgi:hypothetical protein